MMPSAITLDADLMKVINANRILPGDTSIVVLRRLLRIDKAPHGWIGKGVFLPDGTKVRMGYGDDPTLNGEIKAGQWVIGSKRFTSPSTAASAFVARTRGRRNSRVNGWLYWHVKPPGMNEWALLDSLRLRGRKQDVDRVLTFARQDGNPGRSGHGRAA